MAIFHRSDLRAKILEIEPDTDIKNLDTFQDGLRETYVTLLLKHPNKFHILLSLDLT